MSRSKKKKGGRPPKGSDGLGKQVTLRVSPGDRAEVDALAEALYPATSSQVMRAALRLGLEVMRADPQASLRRGLEEEEG